MASTADDKDQPGGNLQPSPVDAQLTDDAPTPERRIAWAASFSGPLPPPDALAAYDDVQPGLAREIVEQWKTETAHRHRTIDGLRDIDHQSMTAYYAGERRGQWLALAVFLAVVAVAVLAIVLHRDAVGIAAIVTGGASAIWAMRRQSDTPAQAIDLADSEPPTQPSDAEEH